LLQRHPFENETSSSFCLASRQTREGIRAATNPDCIKDGAGKGIKIVFIHHKAKRVLVLANRGAGKEYLGD
jgi:hypothetical protein